MSLPAPATAAEDLRFRVGVDIVGVERIARLITENPEIPETLFTARELAYCLPRRRCHEHLAARFAAKEAVLKAFGTGVGPRMRWTDVEVVNRTSGRPQVFLYGEVAAWARRHDLAELDVSLSHTDGLAVAQAIAVWKRLPPNRDKGEISVRFHLIDRVDSYEPSRSVRARKLTSRSEEFWDTADEADGVMPPPLILEALCQAGTWLIISSTEMRKRAALLSIASVEFGASVRPGDVLDIEGLVDSMNDEIAVLSGKVTVEGRTVLEARDIMCALMDADTLEAIENTERMQKMLTRTAKDT